jgi:hypothetical protein
MQLQYYPRQSMVVSVRATAPPDNSDQDVLTFQADGTRVVRDFVESPSQMLGQLSGNVQN